jgi:hypothetical protein
MDKIELREHYFGKQSYIIANMEILCKGVHPTIGLNAPTSWALIATLVRLSIAEMNRMVDI